MPQGVQEDSQQTEERIREITPEAEENMRSVILNVYACQSASQSKKVALSTSTDPENVMSELLGN